jgi:hypothetical protein
MANRGYLLNSSAPTADPSELDRLRSEPGHVDAVVAESANRLLIPWFLCFRREDLKPAQWRGNAVQMPCTTVEKAVRNLEASQPVFEAIAGQPEIGRQWCNFARTMTSYLPLPYLLLEIDEILDMGDESDAEAMVQHIAGALSGDLSAVPHLKALAEYEEGERPFPIDVLYNAPWGKEDSSRGWNTTVLDCGFVSFEYIHWNKAEATPAPKVRIPPQETFGQLRDVRDRMSGWIKDAGVSDPSAGISTVPGEPDQLRGDIYAESDEEARRLEQEPTLASRLDLLARRRMRPWCEKNGFAWAGFHFSSPDWKRKAAERYRQVQQYLKPK